MKHCSHTARVHKHPNAKLGGLPPFVSEAHNHSDGSGNMIDHYHQPNSLLCHHQIKLILMSGINKVNMVLLTRTQPLLHLIHHKYLYVLLVKMTLNHKGEIRPSGNNYPLAEQSEKGSSQTVLETSMERIMYPLM